MPSAGPDASTRRAVDVPALVERADRIAVTLLANASRKTGRDYFKRH